MSENPIKTPKQLIIIIIASFIIPIFVIVLLTQYVANLSAPTEGEDAYSDEAVSYRIQPLGSLSTEPVEIDVNLANSQATESTLKKVSLSGEEVYNARCAACHAAGLLQAPKFGDNVAWKSRLSQGLDKLVYSALNGKGSMAAQGGGIHSDDEIKGAVIYLSNNSGANFK
ncbi:MAG: hypothetical protein CBD16_08765 [Betaproteobacteria bacterium TMED156]|nr:MAG: hypothetical protein CBD16_08765 [Betaproteobacteria bacterium TMED156]|tara:strand:- start:1043 stop:1552 length:510 start_codon:yes stop_codon:yes gene_type:complete